MKKVFMSLFALLMAMNVNAQFLNDSETPFGKGKAYVGASVSGMGINYSKASEWSFGLRAKAGYLFLDNWMVLGVFDYDNKSNGKIVTTDIGAGARYYFDQIGIYAGLIAKYSHASQSDEFVPEIHAGYAFFLGRHVTLEPELYFAPSFKTSDHTEFGLRLGFGYFF